MKQNLHLKKRSRHGFMPGLVTLAVGAMLFLCTGSLMAQRSYGAPEHLTSGGPTPAPAATAPAAPPPPAPTVTVQEPASGFVASIDLGQLLILFVLVAILVVLIRQQPSKE